MAVIVSAANASNTVDQEPMQLLGKMCQAMNQTSFRGTLVYLHDNQLESMDIAKSHTEAGQAEKIYSLNGEARQVIRQNGTLMCIIPNAKKVTIESREHSQLPFSIPQNLDNVQSFYTVSIQGNERVADMDSFIVQLEPKDAYRYGRKLWIGKKYNMLLKSDVLGAKGQALEQMMFTSLNVVERLPDDVFAPSVESSAYKQINISSKIADQPKEQMLHWRLDKAPVGFTVVSHNRTRSSLTGQMIEHLFLSDGMASVSIFIEPKVGEVFEGESRMGAVNAYGSVKSGHKVVTVGAVPPVTVRLINQNIVLAE